MVQGETRRSRGKPGEGGKTLLHFSKETKMDGPRCRMESKKDLKHQQSEILDLPLNFFCCSIILYLRWT